MKRNIAVLFALAAVIVLSLFSFTVSARAAVIKPGLSFKGTKAECSLIFVGDTASDFIEATIELKCGKTVVATWNVDSTETLIFSDNSVTAIKGRTYTLTASVTINGNEYAPTSYSATNS